jgi:hypothetical protein
VQECTPGAVPNLPPLNARAVRPFPEFFVTAGIVRTIAEIAYLTGKVAGKIRAYLGCPFYPVVSFKAAEDEK